MGTSVEVDASPSDTLTVTVYVPGATEAFPDSVQVREPGGPPGKGPPSTGSPGVSTTSSPGGAVMMVATREEPWLSASVAVMVTGAMGSLYCRAGRGESLVTTGASLTDEMPTVTTTGPVV